MYCDFAAIMHFVANYVKFCKNAMLGGLPDLLQYYIGGSSETPKLYYVIYDQPLKKNNWTASDAGFGWSLSVQYSSFITCGEFVMIVLAKLFYHCGSLTS